MRATILLADYANLTGNGKINVMGLFRQINSSQFPFRHLSMYLVIKLQTEPIENLRGERVMVARLVDADGSVLQQLEMPFKFTEWEGGLRPEANFILQLNNLLFSYPGEYIWDVFVNDENVGEFEFYLSQQATKNG